MKNGYLCKQEEMKMFLLKIANDSLMPEHKPIKQGT